MTTETQLRQLSRVLAEIAHTLEASDEHAARVDRVLRLAQEIVPCRRCALLEIDGDRTTLYVSGPADWFERNRVEPRLRRVYDLIAGGDEVARSPDPSPALSLPVMGLDEIIGVIRVERADEPYDARHLRLLSVISAQLGAYLAMVRLRERDRAQTKALAAAHDFQRLLAGVVGHDLRNPLAVIQAVASSLLQTTADEKQAAALRRALRNVGHATSLITDLVDVTESRVSGTIRVLPTDEDFGDIVATTIGDLRHAHAQRTIDYAGFPQPLTGRCDALRFAQILTNLVNNALLHGDPQAPIGVALRGDDDAVELTVHNQGPAIPAELVPRIFDPFRQGPPPARPPSVRGLGLGLYIVDCLARGHGGEVTVDSRDGHGTTFTVRVPRNGPALHDVAPTPPRPQLVLIVDDDHDIREGVVAVLQSRGYDTAEARHGQEALDRLRAGLHPDLILLDLHMPVMDGATFCDACARDAALASIPIVVVSSDTASAGRMAAKGARAFLSKPVPIERLMATIESVH